METSKVPAPGGDLGEPGLTNSQVPSPGGDLGKAAGSKYWNRLYIIVFLFLVLQVIFYDFITKFFR